MVHAKTSDASTSTNSTEFNPLPPITPNGAWDGDRFRCPSKQQIKGECQQQPSKNSGGGTQRLFPHSDPGPPLQSQRGGRGRERGCQPYRQPQRDYYQQNQTYQEPYYQSQRQDSSYHQYRDQPDTRNSHQGPRHQALPQDQYHQSRAQDYPPLPYPRESAPDYRENGPDYRPRVPQLGGQDRNHHQGWGGNRQ